MKALPYKRKRSSAPAKRPRNRPIGQRRAIPEIFVRVDCRSLYPREQYAKAHIRVRRGCYRFLVWRDGNKVREFYLGRLRQASPTEGPSSSSPAPRPAEASARSARRAQKRAGVIIKA